MYTYNEHLQRCAEYARQGISDKETYVQLRILKGQTTACARILGLWVTPEGSHLWRLALQWPFSGLKYAAFERVRLCSGVGGCTCQTQHGADTGRGGAPLAGWRRASLRPRAKPLNGFILSCSKNRQRGVT